jgi:hypothetical protein
MCYNHHNKIVGCLRVEKPFNITCPHSGSRRGFIDIDAHYLEQALVWRGLTLSFLFGFEQVLLGMKVHSQPHRTLRGAQNRMRYAGRQKEMIARLE